MRLKVCDALLECAETEASVFVGIHNDDELLPAPNIIGQKTGNSVLLSWQGPPSGADYLMVRLNDFDLGVVPSNLGSLEIGDIDFTQEAVITAAWLMTNGEPGAWAIVDVREASGEVIIGDEDILAPNTAVNSSVGIFLIVAFIVWTIKNICHEI